MQVRTPEGESTAARKEHRLPVGQFLYLDALCVVPFVTLAWVGQQRELPRHAWVQLLALGCLALQLWRGRSPWQQRYGQAAAALAVCLGCSAIASDSMARSLAGAYQGHAGALSWWACLALLVAAPPPQMLHVYARAFLALGCVQAAVCAFQDITGHVAIGTLGHPMFVASWFMMTGLVAFGVGLDETRRPWWLLALFASLAAGWGMWLTARRGPLLAFAVGAAALVVWSGAWRRLAPLAAAWTGGALMAALLGRQPEPLARRLADTGAAFAVEGGFDTAAQRLDFYRVVLDSWTDRALWGRGFGAFQDVYATLRASHIPRYEIRIHNVLLDMLFSAGAAGLAGLVVLGVALALALRTGTRQMAETPQRGTAQGVAAMAVAYVIHLMFNFDQPATAAWAWTLVGMVAGGGAVHSGAPVNLMAARHTAALWMRRGLALGVAVLACMTPWALAADGVAEQAARNGGVGNIAQAVALYDVALSMVPYECHYALTSAVVQRHADRSATASHRAQQLNRCALREPHNAFVHHHLAQALEDLGPSEVGARTAALEHHRLAVALSPWFPMFRVGLAQALLERSSTQEALDQLDEVLVLDPGNAPARALRALVLSPREGVGTAPARPGQTAAETPPAQTNALP